MTTRRGLLGAFGAAALLGGCGDDSGPAPRADELRGGASTLADVALLNDALEAERRTIGVLPRARAHVAALERAITGAGGEPRSLPSGRPPPTGAEEAAAELVAFYVDLLAKLAEPELRERASALLADAARALARARVEDGRAAAPSAFEEGRTPA